MSLSVTEPALVSLPPGAKVAVVVNRSKPADDSKNLDAIHRTMNAETKQIQAEGSGYAVTGLTDALIRSGRFAAVKTPNDLDLRSYGAGVFPVTLSWDTVDKICSETHADLLFSLELYDVDSKVGLTIASMGRVVSSRVNTGWRIYDIASHSVLDKFTYYSDLSVQGSIFTTASAMLGYKEEVRKASARCGADYVSRIVPYTLRLSRYYYVRGNSSFAIATRMARTGDWDGAAKIWKAATTARSGKVAGRACYNMAIISEINGDPAAALQWAQKAYTYYKTPYALDYANILQQRVANDAVLRNQTELTSN